MKNTTPKMQNPQTIEPIKSEMAREYLQRYLNASNGVLPSQDFLIEINDARVSEKTLTFGFLELLRIAYNL